MEISMRYAILLLAALCGLAATGTRPAEAVGTRYPFCLQGDEFPGLSNCTFVSYEQCAATASGRRLSCVANPYYAGGNDAPPVYGRRLPPPPLYPPPYRSY
jgi:Protein of unknown function (DUF3551)